MCGSTMQLRRQRSAGLWLGRRGGWWGLGWHVGIALAWALIAAHACQLCCGAVSPHVLTALSRNNPCRRIARIRLAAAFAGWQQHTADLAAARQQAEQLGANHDEALLQDCFVSWAAWAASRAEQQAALMAMVERRAVWMQANVLQFWRALVQHNRQRQAQLQRAVRKLSVLRQRQAWQAWRSTVEEQRAEAARLALAERRLASRHSQRSLAAAFVAWRGHTTMLAAARAAVDAKVAAEDAVVRRHTLAAWFGATQAAAERRDHLLRVCVERRAAALQSKALFALQLHAQVRLGQVVKPAIILQLVLGCCQGCANPPSKLTPLHLSYLCSAAPTTARQWS